MKTCENKKVNHWNIPRTKKCVLKITNHFHGYNLTKWAVKIHEIVINGYYDSHYIENIQGSRLSQKMGAESNNETPNVKANLINGDNFTLRTIFRSASLPMTGKTAGATKPAPIGAASLGASAPPSGTTTSPPTVGPVMGAPGSLATATPTPGTTRKRVLGC